MANNSQFVWYAGTSGQSGLVAGPITLMSTELVSLASSGTVLASSTTSGTSSGIFTSSMTGQAVLCDIFLTVGTSAAAGPAAAGDVAGWFLTTSTGAFERTVASTPMSRAPDFVIPISTNAITAADIFRSAAPVRVPALQWKLFVQNNLGITFPSSATAYSTLQMAPYAVQFST